VNVLKPHKQTTIFTLLGLGKTQHEIARVTGIDRKTIRSYQREFESLRANSPGVVTDWLKQIPPPWPPTPTVLAVPLTPSKCEPHRTFIDQQLRLGRNAVAIYQELVDVHGFEGAYNSVKRFAANARRKEPEQFDRLSFQPGEEMQVDYGEGAPTLVPGTGKYRKPRLFVATLRYSRRSFRRVVWKSGQQVWAELHEQAWRYFGGSTRYVVLDNLKEGVLKPDLYEPELNPVYAATLAHYEVVADPARVRDPNRKGTVENAIGHTQATALKGRRFETLDAQNEFLEHWESKWAASRIHGAERRQVQAMFEEERPHLQPLPLTGMQYFTQFERTVIDDGCVRDSHSSYAARPAPIGSIVLVRRFERHLEIRDKRTHQLLRTHTRAERPGTVKLPLAERIYNPSRETLSILRQARAIGTDVERLCEMLFSTEGRAGQRKLWGIVGLARRYPHFLINAACAQALDQGPYSYKFVKALTEKKAEEALAALETASETTPAASSGLTQHHELIRSTQEYGDLFAHATTPAVGAKAGAQA
jgi:transposase